MIFSSMITGARLPGLRLLSILIGATIFAAGCAAQDTLSPRPNIVMIVSDDHGREGLGAYGGPAGLTPHLDALAADGQIFTRAYASSAVCSPSRATLFTGRHSHAHGVYGLSHHVHNFHALPGVKSLPKVLSAQGYHTIRVGKFHVAPVDAFAFDRVVDRTGAEPDDGREGGENWRRDPVGMAQAALTYLADHDAAEGPFFLYVAPSDPHRIRPYDTYPEPNSFGNDRAPASDTPISDTQVPAVTDIPAFLPDTDETRRDLEAYYQSVARLDRGVGRLIDGLKAEGLYEDTLVLYLTDNGVAFPSAKNNFYDPGLRLPLIVKQPGEDRPGAQNDTLTSWADLFATILDYAQMAEPPASQGISLRPVLAGETIPDRTVFASQNLTAITKYYPMRMVRQGRYKLIWNIVHELNFPMGIDMFESTTFRPNQDFTGQFGPRPAAALLNRPEFELYDLEADPGETTNLATSADHQDVLSEMIATLKIFQRETNDPWLDRWTAP